jgi:hypothetical protein
MRRITSELSEEEKKETDLERFVAGVYKDHSSETRARVQQVLQKVHAGFENDIRAIRQKLNDFFKMMKWDQRKEHERRIGRERIVALLGKELEARRQATGLYKNMARLDKDEHEFEEEIKVINKKIHEEIDDLQKHSDQVKDDEKKIDEHAQKLESVLSKITGHLRDILNELMFLMKISVVYYFDFLELKEKVEEELKKLQSEHFPPDTLSEFAKRFEELDKWIDDKIKFEYRIGKREHHMA